MELVIKRENVIKSISSSEFYTILEKYCMNIADRHLRRCWTIDTVARASLSVIRNVITKTSAESLLTLKQERAGVAVPAIATAGIQSMGIRQT